MAVVAEAVAQKIKIPPKYICSITEQIMVDPVFAADGHTYEREAIEDWLKTHDTSPKTNLPLRHKELVENHDKRGDILEFLEQNPELRKGDEVYLRKSWINGLVAAIKANKIEEVQQYLARDTRLLTSKLEGEYTAFHLACQFGSAELVNILLENLTKRNELSKISVSPVGFKPLHLNVLLEKSLIEADKSKFSLLLKLGAELHQVEGGTQNTLLHKLVVQGKLEPVKWLLDKGLAVESRNVEGNTPLLLAVLHEHLELAEFLLKNKAEIQAQNKQKQSALSIALVQQSKPLLNLLVGPEKAALPGLHLALAVNNLDLLKLVLIQEFGKASLESVDTEGRTPLYALVAKDSKEVKEKEEAINLLLDAGANPAVVCGIEKLTPLHLAVQQGDLGMLKRLLQTKAVTLVDAGDVNGDTPLHLAVRAGRENVIPLLLEAGAGHKARNNQDLTPIELAKQQGKTNSARLIEQTARALKRAKFEKIERLSQLVQSQASRIEELEREMTKLKQRMGPEKEKKYKQEEIEVSIRSPLIFSSSSSSSSISSSSSYPALKPDLKVSAEDVQKFLNHVAAGEQNEAEAMLKKNSELALASGTVTDHAKRTFKNITGFQYAVWALDWQMWKMIKSYLPVDAAQEQSIGFAEGSWVKEHGEHANWKKLMEAQQTLIDNWQSWSWERVDDYWVKQVGGGQLLLPMHVLQEYNQPDRPFYPCPKFDADYALTRGGRELGRVGGGYYRGWSDVGAVGRGLSCARGVVLSRCWRGVVAIDVVALAALFSTRTQQRDALVAELAKRRSASPSK